MASCITTTFTLSHPLSSSSSSSSSSSTSSLPFSTNSKTKGTTNPSTQPSPILSSHVSSSILPWSTTKISINNKRGFKVVTRAGPTSTTSLIAAFVMPITLVLATVFTSIRIADKLDEDFLEEMMINEGMMQGEEGDGERSILVDDKSAIPTWAQEKPDVPRTRNRPKREAEV